MPIDRLFMKPIFSTPPAPAAVPVLPALPVHDQGDELTISSRDFAAGLGVQHKHLLETIRQHQPAIEAHFGRVPFETAPLPTRGGVQPITLVYLTENQALFVGTLSRNSERVIKFKATLVRSFAEARRRRYAPAPAVNSSVLADHYRRLQDLEQQMSQLLANQQQAARSLLELPRSSEVVPEETTRMKVQRIVNGYSHATGKPQQDVWRLVYERLYYRYSVRIRAYQKRSDRESWLDVAERTGHLDKIYAIVSAELH